MDEINLKNVDEAVQVALENKNYRQVIEESAGLVALASVIEDTKYLLLGKFYLAKAYFNLHEYQSSMEKYLELTNMVLSKEIVLEELSLEASFFDQVRFGMASNMYNLGDLDGSSIVLGHILENTEHVNIFIDSTILLGIINLKMYELDKNLNYVVPTLEMYVPLLEEITLTRSKEVLIFNTLATLFTYQEDYQKAQEMLNNSIIKANSPEEMLFIYNLMVKINLEMNKIDKAQKNLEKAEEYLGKCQNLCREKGAHYLVKGLYNRQIEQYAEAQRLLERSLYLARVTQNQLEQINVCRELATLYEMMGHDKESEYYVEYKNLKNRVNSVKKIIGWQDFWPDSQSLLFKKIPWRRVLL